MSDDARKYAADTRGRPFQPGNPGKPAGARNRATMAAEALLDAEAEGLTRKCIELALAGDTTALRLCLERILPPRKSRPVEFALPPIGDAASVCAASVRVLELVAAGELSVEEGKAVQELIARHVELHDAAAVRSDLDRVLEHLGLPRATRPGELVALMANGHGDGQHRA
jgi:hypothetical protein